HELHIVEVGHSDTDGTSVLHVPDLGLVVAGDRPPRTRAPFLPEPEGRQMPSGSGSAPAFAARAYHSALDFGVRFWLT
ncbi:hypothetical protein AB0H19_00005, partial [Streptomyces albogriseolus]